MEQLQLPHLFHRDNNNRIRVWFVEIEGNAFTTYSGIEGMTLTPNTTFCSPKNIGKANETTGEEQAISEATSKWNKKYDLGYRDTIEASDKAPRRPNLCLNFKDAGHRMEFPCFASTKLNGMRITITEENGKFTARSRYMKEIRIPSHIQKELENNPLLPSVLDGEFYAHGMHLQDILSLIKRQTIKDGDREYERSGLNKIEFRIFDLPHPSRIATERLLTLAALSRRIPQQSIKFVEHTLVETEQEMHMFMRAAVKEGFEGVVVRAPKGTYDYGRKTKNMMKLKPFYDEEFRIKAIEFDKNNLAYFVLEMANGNTFESMIEGKSHFSSNTVYRQYIAENPQEFIDKKATVKYYEKSIDGVPLNSNVTAIRDYE